MFITSIIILYTISIGIAAFVTFIAIGNGLKMALEALEHWLCKTWGTGRGDLGSLDFGHPLTTDWAPAPGERDGKPCSRRGS